MRRRPQSTLQLPNFPSVESRVSESTEIWARDLRSLFEHAKERFGDVSWESEEVEDADRIWGHKAVIYARAPKAFKDRYFISRPFSRSPTSLQSQSPHLLPPLFPSRGSSPPSSFNRPSPFTGTGSSLSVQSITSDGTIRAKEDGVLRLTHGDTPEMFQAQLEWLYTGEGFGDVVEWISAEDDYGLGGSLRDSLGRRGNMAERRDRLGQDLTYMWRSKLYCDVRIHLASQIASDAASEDSDNSTDSHSSTATAIFPSHRFILASRSPYFASVLLNPSSFRPSANADIHLPTPPFTPAALHFCLGFICAGHLDFSNRSFDLLTAFQIHRAAAYLQLDTLIQEIEARIVHDFCHGLDFSKCHCRRCPSRAARVWRFSSASDVGAVVLEQRARSYLIRGWGESWGREVGSAERVDLDALVKDVLPTITPTTVVSAFRSIETIRSRIEVGLRARRSHDAASWVDGLEDMLDAIEAHTRGLLIGDFANVADGGELWNLLSGMGFAGNLLEKVVREIIDGVGTLQGCIEGPRIYQALVSALLLKVDPETLQTVLPPRSRSRQQIEQAKEGVLGHIRRRWMQIRDAGGFDGLENWSLKEISDELPIEDLVSGPTNTRHRFAVTPKAISRLSSASVSTTASDTTSIRNAVPAPNRASTSQAGPSTPAESSGLKRLRLSSSASTSSMASSRSVPVPRPMPRSTLGPRARSPTAAKASTTVAIGRPRPSSPSPSTRTIPRSMSGPPRQLVTRPSPKQGMPESPSAKSVRTTGTAKAMEAVSKSVVKPMTPVARPEAASSRFTAQPSSEAGPSRSRTTSTSTTASVRSKAISTVSKAPSTLSKVSTASKAPVNMNTPRTVAKPVVKPAASTRPRTSSVSTTASLRSRPPTITGNPVASTKTANNPRPSQLPSPTGQSYTLKSFKLSSPVKPVRPVSPKPLFSATAARLRTASTASNASKTSVRTRIPPSSMTKPIVKPSVRSPSSSTDEPPEARTPWSSQIIDPIIRREGSDGSDLGIPSSPTKLPPPVSMPRQIRKSSSSSSRSTASALRSHPASAFDPPKRLLEMPSPIQPAITDGSKPYSGAGLALHVGIPCIVSLAKKRARFKAQVKYIGHLRGSRGPWIGVEVEDLARFGVDTLPSGSKEGVHYFHLSPSEDLHDLDAKAARQRRLDVIREGMPKRSAKLFGLGLGLGRPQEPRVPKRSISPSMQDWGGIERPRALFVRPSEVVFILGAE